MSKRNKRLGTLAIHAGQTADPSTGSRAVPLYQTTSYVFNDAQHAADLFALKEPGNIYTRLMNPTTDVLERRVAAIEGGTAGLAVASGMAAISYALLAITRPGDEVLSADNLYGGTYELLNHTFPKLGRSARFVDSTDLQAFRKGVNERTRAIFLESVGNPKLDTPDFEAVAEIAHDAGIPLVVDNTIGVGLVAPIEHGADVLASSATKYIGGHGTSLGGIIVDSGRFDWSNGKFPEFTEPDPTYHGTVYADYGAAAYVIKCRMQLMRDFGMLPSAQDAFLLDLGLQTLPVRMERHCQNAQKVAEFLTTSDKVEFVNYPGLPGDSQHEKAKKYLPKGCSGVISFSIKGPRENAARFMDALQIASTVTHVADIRTLALQPANTTHRQLTDEQLQAGGITPGLIRFSVGLENIDDILSDVKQALDKV